MTIILISQSRGRPTQYYRVQPTDTMAFHTDTATWHLTDRLPQARIRARGYRKQAVPHDETMQTGYVCWRRRDARCYEVATLKGGIWELAATCNTFRGAVMTAEAITEAGNESGMA